MKAAVARLLREPLLHFLVAGLAIFAIWGGGADDPADRSITITEPQVRALASQWEATWNRTPTPAEIDAMIRERVKDEVYYREALRLGLDADDQVVRRRMRAKMEFLVAAQSENEVPDDVVLQGWLDRNRARYAVGPVLSFDQLLIDVPAAEARAMLARLNAGADPASLDVALALPPRVDKASADDVDRQFGDGFASLLEKQPQGRWVGPLRSGLGVHLARVRGIAAGQVPPLSAIRKTVENDWRAASRTAREAKAYQALLDGYTVRIANP